MASPGYAPGIIAVNVTWMERGFNAGHAYPSIFNRLRAIARYFLEIATFSFPILHLAPLLGSGLEVRRYGPVWHTGTSLVGLKAYRHFFLARCHTGMP